jgi:hypothetical protein
MPAPPPFVERQEGNLPPLNTFAVHSASLSQGRILAVIPVGPDVLVVFPGRLCPRPRGGKRTMRTFAVMLLVLSAAAGVRPAAQAPATPSSSQPEILHVDGAKNPELIPQWSVWGFVFRVIAGGPRQLPSSVLSLVSREEEALVMKEADAAQKVAAGCLARLAKTSALLGTETVAVVDAKVRELSIDCRRETLHARDRVLSGLSPAAAAALAAFAESTKDGTSISLPKKDLARWLEPE